MDVFTQSQIEYANEFDKEELNFFPEYKPLISYRFFGNSVNERLTSTQILFHQNNHLYSNTDYYYKSSDLNFLHFTKYESLISILKSQTIRLRTLSDMNDKREIKFVSEIFNIENHHSELLQKEIFTLSLVKYFTDNKKTKNNTNSKILWQEYGRNGAGVAIKFKILNNPIDWHSYHLNQIYYGEIGIERLKLLSKKINKFQSENPSLYIHMPHLFAFYKDLKWEKENEIRLMLSTHYNSREGKHYYSIVYDDPSKMQMPPRPIRNELNTSDFYFVNLPLFKKFNCNNEERYFETSPKIVIDEIILGYEFKSDHLVENRNEILKLIKDSDGFEIDPKKIYIKDKKDIF